MSNNKRKRAVILALIAFFCGATAFVSVDWKRFGGGFLAFLKPKGDPVVAHAGRATPAGGGILTVLRESPAGAGQPPALTGPAASHRKNKLAGGAGGHLSDDDLFKYGEPAAGAIPPGSFLVASNDTPGGGSGPVGGLSATETDGGSSSGGEAGGGSGVGSPAPAPTGGSGGFGDGDVIHKSPAPTPAPTTPAPSPAGSPPAPAPAPAPTPGAPAPAPSPAPTQSGTSDENPGPGGGGTPPVDTPPPVAPTPPVSAVPEASESAMMALGVLFLAVAATRRRNNG